MRTQPHVNQRIAAAASAALKDAGISQRDAAARTGIPLATLSRRLTGQSPFIVTELELLAGLVGSTLSQFLAHGDGSAA